MKKNPWLIGLLILILTLAFVYPRAPALKNSVGMTVLERLLLGFGWETAQTRFMSYATTVTPLKRLELAKLNQVEVFERASQAKLFWDKMILPEVVVQATVPVEYRYYVDLNEEWQIVMKDQALTVVAPAPVAGTPSPDISQLHFEVRKGSLFRNEDKVAEALQAELTGLLQKRAQASALLIRETARQQIASLVSQWLSSEARQQSVTVKFVDEMPMEPALPQ